MTQPGEIEADEKAKYEQLRSRFLSLRERKKWHIPLSSIRRLPVTTGEKLTSQYPKVETHWLFELNSPYKPDDFNPLSNYLAWWRCSKGPDHVYEQAIKDHVMSLKSGSVDEGCPFCAGLLPSVTNTLKALFPEIAAQFNEERNGPVLTVIASSPKPVWWQCSRVPDHEWLLSVAARVERQSECPHCKKGAVDLSDYPLVAVHFDKK